MNEIKKAFAAGLTAVALLASSLALLAQPAGYVNTYPGPNTVSGGYNWTNWIAGATAATPTNGVPYRIDLAGAKELSVELTFKCAATNDKLCSVLIGRNNSGLTGTTNIQSLTLLSVTANGTTFVSGTTNLDMGASRYAYIMWVTNNNPTAASGMTNWAVYYNTK